MSAHDQSERVRSLVEKLARFADDLPSGTADSTEIDRAIAELERVRIEVFGPRKRAARGAGAKAKLISYLVEHVGETIHGEQLRAVGGIQEWARRVRELRVEDGYEIVELGRSAYRLESAVPNAERARQWTSANVIRKQPGSARSRIEKYLEANVSQVVTREQIDYVAQIAEGSRRVRELRDEHGWPIASHIDDPELAPGEYRLLSVDPADRRDASQRMYPEELRQRVFVRDGYTCQICHRDREQAVAAGDLRFYLEVHHKVAMADDLTDVPMALRHDIGNLVTLCHSDHIRETARLHEAKRRSRRA